MIKAFFVMLLFVWYRHRLGLTLKVLITTAADMFDFKLYFQRK